MKFVRGFRNDTSVNVIKRSPPLPFVRVFKNSLQAEINYTKIFELGEHFSQSSEERGGHRGSGAFLDVSKFTMGSENSFGFQ